MTYTTLSVRLIICPLRNIDPRYQRHKIKCSVFINDLNVAYHDPGWDVICPCSSFYDVYFPSCVTR